jgi:two-component system sensor histidine kinase ChiS
MRRLNYLWSILIAIPLVSCLSAGTSNNVNSVAVEPTPAFEDPSYHPPDPWSTIRFNSFNVEDGLSQSTVRAIIQDKQGFLWIGTEDGLNRYDGYRFKIYRPDPEDPASLSDRFILDLYEDSEGFLWIATRQGGLNKYDPKTDKFSSFRHVPENSMSLSSDYIQTILEDTSGRLWVGTSAGLDSLDKKTGSIDHYRYMPDDTGSISSNNITSLAMDKKGTLWVGTGDAGINQFDPVAKAFRHFRNDPKDLTTISADNIRSIQVALNGNLWIGTPAGLSSLNPETGLSERRWITSAQSTTRSPHEIMTTFVDRSGNLWIGTVEQGLDRFDEGTNRFINYHHIPALPATLSNNSVLSIYEDREGILWVGTYGGGINKYNRNQDKYTYYRNNPENPDSLTSNIVFNFSVDPSGVTWIATADGLERFDPVTGKFLHYKHVTKRPGSLSNNRVWFVLRDSKKQLWVATNDGLNRLDEPTGQFVHYFHYDKDLGSIADNIVYSIFEDRSGALWFGTRQGLDRYDPETNKFIHYRDPNMPLEGGADSVSAISEDSAGRLWVGTYNSGLFTLDSTRNKFTYYKHDPTVQGSISNNLILAITRDSTGVVWIGTDSGLNKYLPETDSFEVYTEQNGLPNEVIYGIVGDKKDNLWISTNMGISRFDPKTKIFLNFTVKDGLQGNEFNTGGYGHGTDGSILFGGINGFNIFNPEKIHDNSYIPPVIITDFLVNGQPVQSDTAVPWLENISLKWPQDSLEFTFTALSYTEPQNNQFAYKLEGFDEDWNMTGNNRIGRYTNLPGGIYTLRLKASNNDEVWNEVGRTIQVVVHAPFWKTWWFSCVILIAVFGCIGIIYRFRLRSIEKQKVELERLVNERASKIEQLFEQNKELAVIEERNRLARDLHDSAKQKAFASLAQLGTARGLINIDINGTKKHLGEAENLVYEVIQELTFLIQEMYPIALKDKGLSNALREYVFEWETRNDIRVNLMIDGESNLRLEIEQAIYRIIQESLANIARHSHATKVEFSVKYNLESVEVKICDNGQGFDLEQKPNGIGLRSMRERAKSVGGILEINCSCGNGTQVIIKIPTNKQEELSGGRNG